MGIYRFVLAALVVLFHFGGLGWIVGRMAVFAFYCVSGFLIFQVLDRVYLSEPRGFWRFLCNRFVRLGPLYLTYTVMMLVMVRGLGPAAYVDPGGSDAILAGMDRGAADLLLNGTTLAPHVTISGYMPVLVFEPLLIPQGWSIGVEASFYLIAPLVVLTTRRRTWRLAIWIAVGLAAFLWGVRVAGLDPDRFQSLVYKNAVASVVVFFAGGAFYYLRRRWGQPLPFAAVLALLLAWVAVVTVPALDLSEGPRSARAFTEYLWLTVLLAGLVALTRVERFRALDVAFGNLCYGVYLNHFLVAGLLLRAGVNRHLDSPDTLPFGFAVLLGSVALAGLTYLLVERPFDRVRARVRGDKVPQSAPTRHGAWRVQAAVLAVAVGLAVLANPVGFAVGYMSQSAAAESPLSPPFDIRWKPGVSDDDRLRFESELGLVDPERVTRDPRGRTWAYRLRWPTEDRVRAIVEHQGVEDTARVDLERFVILQ